MGMLISLTVVIVLQWKYILKPNVHLKYTQFLFAN